MKITLYFVAFAILFFSVYTLYNQFSKNQETDTIIYQNPVIDKYLADPNILYENGFYYFFATGEAEDGRCIPIYRSQNFVNWEFVRGAVVKGNKEDWNFKHFWAPEVIKLNNKFYLYYTASPEESPENSGNRVGLAISDSIQGPYENFGIVIPNASIDGHPVLDTDSSLYIFYTIEWRNSAGLKAGNIYADKMITPEQVSGNPVKILDIYNWQEGSFILKHDNTYFLTYSCGSWGDSTYHVRYATSHSILGPYVEKPDTLMKSNEQVKGPGHHSFFKDNLGNDWIVYHGWDTAYTARYPRIDRIFISKDSLYTNGPTFNRQIINTESK